MSDQTILSEELENLIDDAIYQAVTLAATVARHPATAQSWITAREKAKDGARDALRAGIGRVVMTAIQKERDHFYGQGFYRRGNAKSGLSGVAPK